jgi:hypothetical protein
MEPGAAERSTTVIGPMMEVHAEARRQALLLESERGRRIVEVERGQRRSVRSSIGGRIVRLGAWIAGEH